MILSKSPPQTLFSHRKGWPHSCAHGNAPNSLGRHRQQKPLTGHPLLHLFLKTEAETFRVFDNLPHTVLWAFEASLCTTWQFSNPWAFPPTHRVLTTTPCQVIHMPGADATNTHSPRLVQAPSPRCQNPNWMKQNGEACSIHLSPGLIWSNIWEKHVFGIFRSPKSDLELVSSPVSSPL